MQLALAIARTSPSRVVWVSTSYSAPSTSSLRRSMRSTPSSSKISSRVTHATVTSCPGPASAISDDANEFPAERTGRARRFRSRRADRSSRPVRADVRAGARTSSGRARNRGSPRPDAGRGRTRWTCRCGCRDRRSTSTSRARARRSRSSARTPDRSELGDLAHPVEPAAILASARRIGHPRAAQSAACRVARLPPMRARRELTSTRPAPPGADPAKASARPSR